MLIITNYEYSIMFENNLLSHVGKMSEFDMLDSNISLIKILDNLKITFEGTVNKMEKNKIINNGLIIKFDLRDETGNILTKNIEIILK